MVLDVIKDGFQTIVEKSTDGLLIVDENHVVQFVNPAAVSILNRKQTELIGEPFEFPIKEGESAQIELVRNDGNTKTGEFHMMDIKWNGKRAYLISIRDITSRIMYDRVKDDFISNVSHELRTPLTIIKESVSQVRDSILGDVNDEQKKMLGVCIRNADHLKKIVDDLLDISKIEAGRVKLRKDKADLISVVQGALDTFKPVIQKKGLELKTSLPGSSLECFIDSDRITQVLNNLIGNALKFTENGHIEIKVNENGSDIECEISDTGRGISAEDLPKVFDKFQQFGSAMSAEYKGTGLGLSISKEIIQLHDGKIFVDSIAEEGTTFSFVIPKYAPGVELEDKLLFRIKQSKDPFTLINIEIHNIPAIQEKIGVKNLQLANLKIIQLLKKMGKQIDPVYVQVDDKIMVVDSEPKPDSKMAFEMNRLVKEAFIEVADNIELEFSYCTAHYPEIADTPEKLIESCSTDMINEKQERLNKKILVVDDEVELTESVKTLLQFFEYKYIDTANNGEAVFEKLKTEVPDLLILDMKMPGMSGYEIIGRLKESNKTKDIPILIMSGYELEKNQFYDDISNKAILTISKPASADILRKMVYYLL